MFGYVRPCIANLSEADKQRYKSVYCGLCRSLGERCGSISRLSVNYDMTFLAMMLSSLYEPEEAPASARCLPHPVKPHTEIRSAVIDYAADMTVLLTYFKCLDDWADDHSPAGKLYAGLLKKQYERIKAEYPRQSGAVEESLKALSDIEKDESASPENALLCASQLLCELFVWKEDFWAQQLRWFGASLGRFVYLMDAAMDYEKDLKKGSYNPLVRMDISPANAQDLLTQPLGEACAAFEALPMVQDDHLMRGILYSGVWQSYNDKMKKQSEGKAHGQ